MAFVEAICQPARHQRKAGVENVVKNVEASRDTSRFGCTELRCQLLRREQNQQRVRKIARTKQTDGHEKLAESGRQRAETFAERNVRDWLPFALLHDECNQSRGE